MRALPFPGGDETAVAGLVKLWQQSMPKQVDRMRDPVAWWAVMTSPFTRTFIFPHGPVIYLSDISQGEHATIHFLARNPHVWKHRDDFHLALGELMDLFELPRISLALPCPAHALHRLALFLGFRREAKLVDAVLFDGRVSDLVIYRLLRAEVGSYGERFEEVVAAPEPRTETRTQKERAQELIRKAFGKGEKG